MGVPGSGNRGRSPTGGASQGLSSEGALSTWWALPPTDRASVFCSLAARWPSRHQLSTTLAWEGGGHTCPGTERLWSPHVEAPGRPVAALGAEAGHGLWFTEGHGPLLPGHRCGFSTERCPLLSGLLSTTWPRLLSSRAAAGWGTQRLLPSQAPPSPAPRAKGPKTPLRQAGDS